MAPGGLLRSRESVRGVAKRLGSLRPRIRYGFACTLAAERPTAPSPSWHVRQTSVFQPQPSGFPPPDIARPRAPRPEIAPQEGAVGRPEHPDRWHGRPAAARWA